MKPGDRVRKRSIGVVRYIHQHPDPTYCRIAKKSPEMVTIDWGWPAPLAVSEHLDDLVVLPDEDEIDALASALDVINPAPDAPLRTLYQKLCDSEKGRR